MLFVCFMNPDIMRQGCCFKQEARICQSDVLRQSQGLQPIVNLQRELRHMLRVGKVRISECCPCAQSGQGEPFPADPAAADRFARSAIAILFPASSAGISRAADWFRWKSAAAIQLGFLHWGKPLWQARFAKARANRAFLPGGPDIPSIPIPTAHASPAKSFRWCSGIFLARFAACDMRHDCGCALPGCAICARQTIVPAPGAEKPCFLPGCAARDWRAAVSTKPISCD